MRTSIKTSLFAGGDLLAGANAILNFLVSLGMPEGTNVYYLRRTGRWPIENTCGDAIGGSGMLVASKRRLFAYLEELTRGPRPDGDRSRRPTKPRRSRRRVAVAAPPTRRLKQAARRTARSSQLELE